MKKTVVNKWIKEGIMNGSLSVMNSFTWTIFNIEDVVGNYEIAYEKQHKVYFIKTKKMLMYAMVECLWANDYQKMKMMIDFCLQKNNRLDFTWFNEFISVDTFKRFRSKLVKYWIIKKICLWIDSAYYLNPLIANQGSDDSNIMSILSKEFKEDNVKLIELDKKIVKDKKSIAKTN